jgi:hypothetical protein
MKPGLILHWLTQTHDADEVWTVPCRQHLQLISAADWPADLDVRRTMVEESCIVVLFALDESFCE